MATQSHVTVGVVQPRSVLVGSNHWRNLFPGVLVDTVPGFGLQSLDRGPGWHNAIRGAKEAYLREVPKLAADRNWDAVAISGAPIELMNPGLYRDLAQRLTIPVTTSMVACSAAVKALFAQRALLITGFFEGLDEMVYGYFVREGLDLVLPSSKPFTAYEDAAKASPEVLFTLVKETLAASKGIELVYFQGAVDDAPIIERIEKELGLPVVSSIAAHYWHAISMLGLRCPVEGQGRLLSEWPRLSEG